MLGTTFEALGVGPPVGDAVTRMLAVAVGRVGLGEAVVDAEDDGVPDAHPATANRKPMQTATAGSRVRILMGHYFLRRGSRTDGGSARPCERGIARSRRVHSRIQMLAPVLGRHLISGSIRR